MAIIDMLTEPETVSHADSQALLDFVDTRTVPRDCLSQHQLGSTMDRLLTAVIAEQVFFTAHPESTLSYSQAAEQGLTTGAERTAQRIASALQLAADQNEPVCDSDGVDGIDISGLMTVPFQCPDCAE